MTKRRPQPQTVPARMTALPPRGVSVPERGMELGTTTNYIEGLQEMAVATRLKKLSDQFFNAANLIYQTQNIPFEASWFTFIYLLHTQSAMSLMDMAHQLQLSHSAVSQLASDLTKKGLVQAQTDPTDKRKRLLSLTEEGMRRVEALKPLWADIQTVVRELVISSGYDLLDVLDKTEKSLEAYPLTNRYYDKIVERQSAMVTVVPYDTHYQADFEQLNRSWLETLFEVEPIDEAMFADPVATIIKPGGHIFMALQDGAVVGTCALIPADDPDVFEFAKIGVVEPMRGRGVGEKLIQAALAQARHDGKTMVYLEMNSQFVRAIQLYRKFGFVLSPFDQPQKYKRSNLLLKCNLK